MLARHDVDERRVTPPRVPVSMLQPERLPEPQTGLLQQVPQQPDAQRRHPHPRLGLPARTGILDRVICGRRQRRRRQRRHRARRDDAAQRPAAPGDVLEKRRVRATRTKDALVQVRGGEHPVEMVVAIERAHPVQPHGDRALRKRAGRGCTDATAGVSPLRSQPRNRPRSSTVTPSQASSNRPRNSHHSPSARA